MLPQGGKMIRVRFAGIDAPESTQVFGDVAKAYLESLILGKDVTLDCNGNSFNRQACVVYLGDVDINAEMVKAGLAWDLRNFSHGKYTEFHKAARLQRLGLWAGDSIVSPYCFRRRTEAAKRRCAVNPMTPI